MEQKIELCDRSIEDKIVDSCCHNVGPYKVLQKCLICEQTQSVEYNPEIHSDSRYLLFICDECKEAIAFVKNFRVNLKEVSATLR